MNDQQVFWTQGLFLTPQHLQQSDRYHEIRARAAMATQSPWFWGLDALTLSVDGLQVARLEVEEIAWTTPDGTVLRGGTRIGGGNLSLPPRSFEKICDERGPNATVGVYVALARVESDRTNHADAATRGGADFLPRFRITEQTVADLYEPTDHDAVTLRRIGYQARLVFDAEDGFQNVQDGYDLIKIAELLTIEGGARLLQSYVPPCRSIGAVRHLRDKVARARDRVVERAVMFEREQRERGVRGAGGSVADLGRLTMMLPLNRYGVALYRAVEHGHPHPEEVYALLRAAVGELSAFSDVCTLLGAAPDDSGAEQLPPYEHTAIGAQFDMALDRLDRVLDGMSIGPEMLIELKHDPGDGLYKAVLETKFFEGNRLQYFLIIENPSQRADQITKHINEVGKLGERSMIDQLVRFNRTGVPVEYESHPPESLPRRGKRFFYFRVNEYDRGGENWRYVEEKANIALYSPDLRPDDTKVMMAKINMDEG